MFLSCRWEYCKLSENQWHLSNPLFVCVPQAHERPNCVPISLFFFSLSLPSLSSFSFHSGFSVLDHRPSWDLSLSWLSGPHSRFSDLDLRPPGDKASPLVSLPCVHVVLFSLSPVFLSFLLSVWMVCLPLSRSCIGDWLWSYPFGDTWSCSMSSRIYILQMCLQSVYNLVILIVHTVTLLCWSNSHFMSALSSSSWAFFHFLVKCFLGASVSLSELRV